MGRVCWWVDGNLVNGVPEAHMVLEADDTQRRVLQVREGRGSLGRETSKVGIEGSSILRRCRKSDIHLVGQ